MRKTSNDWVATALESRWDKPLSVYGFALPMFQGVSASLLFSLFYGPVVPELIRDWSEHSTFSYGFLVPFIAGYLVWRRRTELRSIPVAASLWAGIPLFMAVILGLLGQAIGDTFSMRVSMILALGSIIYLLLGQQFLRALLFPLFYLSLMIPVPYVLIKNLVDYLRYSDATYAANALQILGVPVYREMYFLHLPNMTLEVADVCSGVSSVFALFALGVLYAYILPIRPGLKLLLVASTFPFALLVNLFRIILTAYLAYHLGFSVLESTFHLFSGTVTFVLALGMLILSGEVLRHRYPMPARNKNAGFLRSHGSDLSQNATIRFSPFFLGVVIFSAAIYLSNQLDGGQNMSLAADQRALVSRGAYVPVNLEREDGYKDPYAEVSISQVVVDRDGRAIDLFVGFRSKQNAATRLRSPKLYFPDRWSPVWLKPARIEIGRNLAIHGNWLLIGKGSARELVIYWYQHEKATFAGEFEYRMRLLKRLLLERRSDGAVVRVATPVRDGEKIEAAQERLRTLSVHLYPKLVEVLPQ